MMASSVDVILSGAKDLFHSMGKSHFPYSTSLLMGRREKSKVNSAGMA